MDIKRNVKKVLELLHVEKLRKHQQKSINRILNDQDTFVAAPTSAGKSLIYQVLAILHSNKTTLVIEPTIALMHDQVHKLQEHGISAKYLDSTQTKRERTHILNQFSASNINILYLTPERLTSESFLYVLKTVKLFMIVIDEAHCILDWGYGFREAYLHIGEVIDSLKPRPVISAFTATASRKDADEICKLLHMNQPMVFENDLYRKNLTYLKKSANSRHQKQKLMMTYLRKYHNHASIVYCNTRNAVDAVYEFLDKKYPNQVVKCHAEMSAKKRAKHELQFLSGEKSIMAATSAFGMGVDLGTIDLVLHFNMPLSITDYMQQSGRAGRDEQKAHCVLLYSDEDYCTNKIILLGNNKKSAKHALVRLDEMKEFCDETNHCMAQLLLSYFGQPRKKTCNHCTNCQRNRRK